MDGKLIALRVTDKQIDKLAAMEKETGWNQSEIIRRLIDNAKVKSATISVEIGTKKQPATKKQ